jgi:catechol 2,3-dioxygenase-like lactoylglutathione lyase family enzyme
MSAKVHIHLHVSDLARSRAFYEAFFEAPPVKVRPGYVKFLPAQWPVNLALSEAGVVPARGAGGHFGIQVDTPAAVRRELARVRAAGLSVREELGVDCCYANQDKFWVTDPDGVEWEVYHLNHDLEADTGSAGRAAAVQGRGPGLAPATPCCAPSA